MREKLQECRRLRLSGIVSVLVAAGAAAGCSQGSVRLAAPDLFAGSTADRPGIESRDLGPLPSAGPAVTASAPPITTPASLRQRGWTVEGASVVQVTEGDTVATLSQGFGVPASVILEANGLAGTQEVRPGQRLVIPTYVYRESPAPATVDEPSRPETAIAAGPAPRGPGAPPTTLDEQAREGRYRVKEGDTLFSIARTHGVSLDSVARLNGLPQDGTVKIGEVLRIPGAAGEAPRETLVAVGPADVATQETLTDAAPSAEPEEPRVEPASVAPAEQSPPASAVATDGADGFRWPVRGRIIAGFGKQADGARNDGINLAVPAGTPVHAAEGGTVIYAGNELEGYGNLILVQHQDDWVSAYAHNETLQVRRGDKVDRGQVIARVGATGAVDTPQLHFELRKRSKPVDPLPHLSGS